MSKSLKKLIDINGLREFKNKTGSAYVQTGAVDQTVGGTKTFSKPIAGSVTGSSGSCTGNAATATKLQTARTINGTSFDGTANITTANWGTARNISITDGTNTSTAVSVNGSANVSLTLPATIKANLAGNVTGNISGSSSSCTGNSVTATTAGAVSTSVAADNTKDLVYATMANSDAFRIRCGGSGDNGYVEIATSDNGNEPIYVRQYYIDGGNGGDFTTIARTLTLLDGSGNTQFPGTVSAPTFSGNINGNAASATKLAAKRTIALSGAATGTATGFDGSGNITIPVTALAASAIRAQWYAAYPDGAEAHNAMWGGRDITAAFDAGTVSANIANGTFKDIFPGDYITKSVTISGETYDVTWVVADCDYWINKGDTAVTAHHVVIVPQVPIFNANMNATNTTEGGYAGSRMYTETIPACATGIVNAFGASHILTFRDSIVRAVNTSSISSGAPFWTGASSDWGWYDAQCNLMCERMLYGMPAFSSSAWDAGVATRQFSAFRLSERLINYNRQWWWLRDVVSSANFAVVYGDGDARTHGASLVSGVRPFALLI